jgi:hypothetical protein
VRLFKVSRKRKIFHGVTQLETIDHVYPLTCGIVGTCIASGAAINTSKPQFDENYCVDVDCYDVNSFSSSLLVRPIADESNAPKWAVALYNKKERTYFTPLDEEGLAVICKHLFPLLSNAWQDKRLKQKITSSKRQLAQAEAVIDVIASLRSPTDLEQMLVLMNKFFRTNTAYSNCELFRVDRFRQELISTPPFSLEIVPLMDDSSIAMCARESRMLEIRNPIYNSDMLFCPILSSSGSVIGVLKLSGANETGVSKPKPTIPVVTKSNPALPVLSTFRSSLSSSRLLSASRIRAALENRDSKEETSTETVMKMTAMWQRVAGSVLEGAQKHLLYAKRKQLISQMNAALYENQFESSFKVWQETQFLVDGFDDLDDSGVVIDSPVITDIVFANTSELSEKTVQLIQTLQSLNALDETVFAPQTTAPPLGSEYGPVSGFEEEGRSCPFIANIDLDILTMEEGLLIQNILRVLNECDVIQYIGISEKAVALIIMELRGIHPPEPFHSWRLAVDHFQVAGWLIVNTHFGKVLSQQEKIAVLFFCLSLYSDPCQILTDGTARKRTKFTLETGGGFSVLSSFFTACAWAETHLFQNLQAAEKMAVWNGIDELEGTASSDGFYQASPVILLCYLARMSFMIREPRVTMLWLSLRLKEETPGELADLLFDIQSYQLEREMETLYEPLLGEGMKVDPIISVFLDRLKANVSWILEGESFV